MTAALSLSVSPSSILAPIGKNGKVSTANAKAVELLKGIDAKGVISAALSAKGAVGKIARQAVSADVDTAETLLSAPSIDGGKWATLLTLLVGKHGDTCYSRAQHVGKKGCALYMDTVVKAKEVAVNTAETVKSQERAIAALKLAQFDADQVTRLVNVAHAQAMAHAEATEATEAPTTA